MEHDRTFVMLDPTTDQVLAECKGPDTEGRCPVSYAPPYICAGLLLVSKGDAPGQDVSVAVTKMEPGRCPLAAFLGTHPEES